VSIAGTEVVVIGAGIGGLASALLLARSGASVTLVEKHPASATVGAGILLQPNGLAVLSGLGLGRHLQEDSHRMTASRVRDSGGRVIAAPATPDFGDGLDHVLAIRRSSVHRVLEAAVADEPEISVRRGEEAMTVSTSGDVRMHGKGGPSTLTGDLVVGADGVHSTVRTCAGFGATVTTTGQRYIRGLVAAGPSDEDLDGEYWTRLGLFGGARVDASTTYFYASAGAPDVARAIDAADLIGLRRAWAGILPVAGRVLAGVADAGDLLVNDVVRVDCRRWHDGRLVLLGDAAHAMAPTMGQGANSALVDAAVLAQELARPQPLPAALERYDARRRAAVRVVQDRADRVARLAHLTSPVLRSGRNWAMRGLGRLPGSAERMIRTAQQEDPARLFRTVRTLSDAAGATTE
jgi:2-polyprenyl-6-methoxyphenol hydroxylase-like FAD-dependent oxidoreductase